MLLVDSSGEMVLANEHACRLFGYETGKLNGRSITVLLPERYRAAHKGHMETFGEHSQAREMGRGVEVTASRSDGSEFPVEVSLNPYQASNTTYTLVSVREIAGRKASESRIRHLNRVLTMQSRMNALILRAQDREVLQREACRIAVEAGAFSMTWIGLLDPETSQLHAQASCGRHATEYLCGLESELPSIDCPERTAIRENRPVWIQHCGKDSLPATRRVHCKDFGWGSMAVLPLLREGEPVGVLALYAGEQDAFDEEEVKLLTGLTSNLSFAMAHLEKQTSLHCLENYDGLTGLGNRARFVGRVSRYLRNARRSDHKLAVLQFDLERFKNVSDTLGYAAGDLVLKQFAGWLLHEVGEANLLARLDADHFALVLPQVEHAADVELLVERWMAELRAQPFGPAEDTFRISAKVGISIYPEDGATAGILFNHAEAALKQAKASRNRYLFHTPKMGDVMAGKFALENQLRLALDREEFVLYYQPKVDMVTGVLTGAEALIRWNDPQMGLVQPNRFIPMLEETGLICEVGRWALRKALEDALRWRRKYATNVRIALNVSPLQLRNREFIHDIEFALTSDPDAASSLELEVTEGMILEDVEYSIGILRAIRAMGVTIALDDFGTGFCSLSYLSKLPVDTLKIDRAFVVDLTETPGRLTQISAIVNLAHSMNLNIVAEGVETEFQSRLLRTLGCDEMQGFLFSKPLPCSVFESRHLERRVTMPPPPHILPQPIHQTSGVEQTR